MNRAPYLQGKEVFTKGNIMHVYVLTVSRFLSLEQPASPFRRVREEEIELDARVADNSFEAKVGLGSAQGGNTWPLQMQVGRAALLCL